MARCDAQSARTAGVSCAEFYRLQREVADQTHRFRLDLRSLGGALSRRGAAGQQEQATAARLDKYMGAGTGHDRNKIAFVHNVLLNAEFQLRSLSEITRFDREFGMGGDAQPGYMRLGNLLNTNTILHEAIHLGTMPWRSTGDVPYVRDGGNIGSVNDYGAREASLLRARAGWAYTSRSAASFSWVVTGP